MKRLALAILIIISSSLLFSARKALVIGNSSYPVHALRNTVSDAKAVDAALRSLGFDTTLVLEADQMTMEDEVYKFSSSIDSNDEILFYYSGHGANVEGENYLIPVGRDITTEKELKYYTIPANLILEKLENAKITIFVLDACRDNPFKGVRSKNKGLATMQGKAGSQYLIYSTEAGKTATDGEGTNSPFTESFVKYITTSHDQIENVMKLVALEVQTKTFGNQTPWTAGNLSSFFYFSEAKTVSTPKINVETEYLTGKITVECNQEGQLYLDGTFMSSIKPDQAITLNSVPVGSHTLEFRKDSLSQVKNVSIIKNKTEFITFMVDKPFQRDKIPKIEGVTKLKVISELTPIHVEIDEVSHKDLSQGKEVILPSGKHDLKISYQGKDKNQFEAWRQQVVMSENELTTIYPFFNKITKLPSDTIENPTLLLDQEQVPQSFSEKMILVPKGSITLDKIKLRVYSFLIAKYETTQAEYKFIMKTNPSINVTDKKFNTFENHPVNKVNWFDAIEFCNRLSIKENLEPCYTYDKHGTNPDNWPTGWNKKSSNRNLVMCNWSADGYRLPTETEWMFAAAGGMLTQNYIYSGRDNMDESLTVSGSHSYPVGSTHANELGLYDMSGNVSEWCWDVYDNYPMPILDNYRGKEAGSSCVRRGGSFAKAPLSAQVVSRSYSKTTKKEPSMGFRVCRTVM